MTCDELRDRLSPYVDGELDAAARAAVDAPLGACPDCAALAACLRRAVEVFAAFPEVEPSADLRARLAAIPARRKRFRLSLDFLFKPAVQPILAAATGVLMLFSVYMVSPDKGLINRTISRQFHRGLSTIEKLYVKAGSLTDRLGEFANTVVASARDLGPLDRGVD
jgi:anti-sigma factor RsiW